MVFKGLGSIESWENDRYRIAFGVPNQWMFNWQINYQTIGFQFIILIFLSVVKKEDKDE